MEEITEFNRDYWLHYYNGNNRAPQTTSALFYRATIGEYLEKHEYTLPESYKDLEQAILDTKTKEVDLCKSIKGEDNRGLNDYIKRAYNCLKDKEDKKETYEKILKHLEKVSSGVFNDLIHDDGIPDNTSYMIYGTTKQVTRDTIEAHGKKQEEYEKSSFTTYQDIVISVPYKTNKDLPIFSHYGLMKYPWHILDPNSPYKNVVMILKGFSAYASIKRCEAMRDNGITTKDKKYITINPIQSLVPLLVKAIGACNIYPFEQLKDSYRTEYIYKDGIWDEKDIFNGKKFGKVFKKTDKDK